MLGRLVIIDNTNLTDPQSDVSTSVRLADYLQCIHYFP